MFEESTSLLVAAGPESTSRLRSTTQLRRGGGEDEVVTAFNRYVYLAGSESVNNCYSHPQNSRHLSFRDRHWLAI